LRRFVAVVVVLVLGIAVLVSTRGGDAPPEALAIVEAAFAATGARDSTGVGLLVRIEDLPPELGALGIAGEGRAAFDGEGASLTLEVTEAMAELTGAEPGRVELVDDGENAFVRQGDGPWRPIAPDGRTGGSGVDLIAGTDPLAGFSFMAAAVVEATEEATDLVRGRQTTRYEVRLDPARLDGDPRPAASIAAALEGFVPVFGLVWVDEDGFVVRARYDADLARLSGGGPLGVGGRFVSEFELFDLDTPVRPELPAPAEVEGSPLDATELELVLGGIGL